MEFNEEEFKNIADKVIDMFYANKHYDEKLMLYLKGVLMKYPNNHCVVSFIDWLNDLITKNLFNYNFMKNLNNNSLYFDRLLELYINRPFSDERFACNDYNFISMLLVDKTGSCGCYNDQLIECMDYFKKIGIERLTDDYIERVNQFMAADANLINYCQKDEYPESYYDALFDYNLFNKQKFNNKKFIEFKNNKCLGFTDDYSFNYYNKVLLGHLGEYYFYNKYIKNNNVRFVSKEIGNGTGYDMYINNGDIFENLYEVKTTASFEYGSDDDKIFISENEFDCMEKVYKSNLSAKYYISRLFYHDNKFEELVLKYIGGETLKCDNIEYNIEIENHKIIARRRK